MVPRGAVVREGEGGGADGGGGRGVEAGVAAEGRRGAVVAGDHAAGVAARAAADAREVLEDAEGWNSLDKKEIS